MFLSRVCHGLRWPARLLTVALVALPMFSVGMASPAFAGGGGGGGWGGGGWGDGNHHTPPPPPTCPSGTAAVTNVSFVINGTTTVTTLGGHVQSGVSVTANYTIATACQNIQVSLAAYRAPAATYDRNTANQQVLFDQATATSSTGPRSLQIFVPAGCFQVDFVLGSIITQLGPANTHNFYGDQGRLIDHDNNCTGPPPTAPRCDLTGIITGPPKQLQVTVQDTGAGLQSIVVTTLTNATVVVPTFTPGSAQALVVVATKVDQSQGAYLGLEVTNTAGLVTDCDPPF
jgi:hypothetical protein